MNRVSASRARVTLAAMIVAFVVPVAAVLAVPQAAGAATTLQITNTSLPGATVGQAYSAQIEVSGGTGPYLYTFIAEPQYPLPPGLSMDFHTGLISGTVGSPPVNQPTTYTVNFEVLEQANGQVMGSKQLSITITPPGYVPPPALQMTTTSVTEATINKAYSFQVQVAGGTAPYVWNETGLPKGFNLSQNGVITGQSSEPQQTTITLSAVDSGTTYDFYGVQSSEQQTVQRTFTFTVSSGNTQLDPVIFQLEAELQHSQGLSTSFLAQIIAELDALINEVDGSITNFICELPGGRLLLGVGGCGLP